jgi:hypothetical protein
VHSDVPHRESIEALARVEIERTRREPDAIAAKAIVALGVPLETVRRRVIATLPPAVDEIPALIPFDAQARKTLELTFREALRLGHNYIGTEHILLALVELEAGNGVLTGLGIDKATAERRIAEELAAPSGKPT